MDVQRHDPMDLHLFSAIVQRIVTFPVDLHSKLQWHVPMDVHFCELWCAISCPNCWWKIRFLDTKSQRKSTSSDSQDSRWRFPWWRNLCFAGKQLRSVLIIAIHTISNWGSQIPHPNSYNYVSTHSKANICSQDVYACKNSKPKRSGR